MRHLRRLHLRPDRAACQPGASFARCHLWRTRCFVAVAEHRSGRRLRDVDGRVAVSRFAFLKVVRSETQLGIGGCRWPDRAACQWGQLDAVTLGGWRRLGTVRTIRGRCLATHASVGIAPTLAERICNTPSMAAAFKKSAASKPRQRGRVEKCAASHPLGGAP